MNRPFLQRKRSATRPNHVWRSPERGPEWSESSHCGADVEGRYRTPPDFSASTAVPLAWPCCSALRNLDGATFWSTITLLPMTTRTQLDQKGSLNAIWHEYLSARVPLSNTENATIPHTSVVHALLNARYYDLQRGQFLSEDPVFLGRFWRPNSRKSAGLEQLFLRQ